MNENINDYKIKKLEEAIIKLSQIPETLSSIQAEIKEIRKSVVKVDDLENKYNKLNTSFKSAMAVITVTAFLFGYIMSMINTNLSLTMEKTARDIVVKELSKYEVMPTNTNINNLSR